MNWWDHPVGSKYKSTQTHAYAGAGCLPAFQTTVRWPKATVPPPATMVGGPRRRRFLGGKALSNHTNLAKMAPKPGPLQEFQGRERESAGRRRGLGRGFHAVRVSGS